MLLGKRWARAIIRIKAQTQSLAGGDLSVSIDTSQKAEIGDLARAVEETRMHFSQIIGEVHRTLQTLGEDLGHPVRNRRPPDFRHRPNVG